jgi:hypothetical protein
MSSRDDDLAEIASNGAVEPLGAQARLHFQARAGTYRVLASPEELVLMRRAGVGAHERPCILCGEVPSAGLLCEILTFVAHAGWRGQFVVHDGGGAVRSVFFDGGHVASAQSAVVRERLGEVLYRYGRLTREQVTQCGDATVDGNLRFGEAAVRLGLLSREEIFSLMERQIEEIFYGVLLVGAGTYFFLEGYDDADLASRHTLSLTTLLRDGIRRMHEMRYFRARIPSEEHVLAHAGDRGTPPHDTHGVYAAIDGARTVAEVCRVVGASEFEVTRTTFQLVQSGHVLVKPPRATPTAIVAVYNRAVAFLLRELDAMDEGDGVREQLAAFAAKAPYARLFDKPPADDGTLDPAHIEATMQRLHAGPYLEERLSAWLHQHASYALFLARPHLRRKQDARDGTKGRVSMRVSAMLDEIAPSSRNPPEPPKTPRGGTT